MAAVTTNITIGGGEYRPCWVYGKRALFHRWADSARPAYPRKSDESKDGKTCQLWCVHAIVEFEDGTVQRVWPSDVKFADGGQFDEKLWIGDQNNEYTDELPY